MSTKSFHTPRVPQAGKLKGKLPGLPTELLVHIFALLQVADLFAVQHTCHRFYNVISDSVFLQYILYTKINLLEDLLPPGVDVSFQDRIALLKHHEAAWNKLDFKTFTLGVRDEINTHSYILQDGYLIYNALTALATARYDYVDLYSISDVPNAARWTHISLAALSDIVFAVDHNLVVAIRFRTSNNSTSGMSC
jgi:hypothetical protein